MHDELNSGHFRAFFHELHGYDPFPWQERLANLVCGSDWPHTLDLPTATGKTACLDVAVFAMAVKMRGPRRVFFVVDRRVVVDAAFARMQTVKGKLRSAEGGVLKAVADRLRQMAQSDEPLDTYQMRGGIYRDDSWVRSPQQPTLIASTVDQTGSRLLFRGYGVADKTLPIHASLVANDSLILLDEAHCSRPFSDTLRAIKRYREWGDRNMETPFAFVEMTATPGRDTAQTFTLSDADYQQPELRKRLFAPKPARLIVSKARAKDFGKLAADLVEEAVRLSTEPGLWRIAIMVNRVRTARLAYDLLKAGFVVHLLIGRMRPVDRSPLPDEIRAMLSDRGRTPDGEPVFVVATQCLEVGADLDFDAIVTECASIDALVQRFGRLDRIGDLSAKGITAQGRVVIASSMTDGRYSDPVYGGALTKTWNWLKSAGDEVDFAICSDTGNATVRERLPSAGEDAGMRREAPAAPVLLPAHLDALVQTFPRPELEPDVHLFLHGREDKGSPEVQVVWRADLNTEPPGQWAEIVALCPPVSAEAMPVPLRDFRAWLSNSGDEGAGSSDVEGADEDTVTAGDELRCPVLQWRGDNSELIEKSSRIRPGDTLIVAANSEGWEELGHKPLGAKADIAERARLDLRRGWVLRLHSELIKEWPENDARSRLDALVRNPSAEESEVAAAFENYVNELGNAAPDWLRLPKAKVVIEPYPTGGEVQAWVLSERTVEADSGQDESSAGEPILLDKHLRDVTEALEGIAKSLIADESARESLVRAARFHDCGKADARFQALLHGGDPMAAQFAPKLLAKGVQAKQSPKLRKAQWQQSGLPKDFRHELISLLLAGQDPDVTKDELALHAIASHHGRCRPFAPVVEDHGPTLAFNGWRITAEQRIERAAHRLQNGVADRFWKLTRLYGWWGLAYLESLVRLADWKASKGDRP